MMKCKGNLGMVATLALLLTSTLSVAPAAADPVGDVADLVAELTTCSIWANEPGGNEYVVGSGGGRACGPNQTVAITVCLDYNFVTVASTCKPKTGQGTVSGSSGSFPCLPGIWQTQVIATTPGPDMKVLSDPVLILCLPPVEGESNP